MTGTRDMEPDNGFPDEEQIARLRETVHGERSVAERLGLGLRALYNAPIFERLPEGLARLLNTLRSREERTDRPHDAPPQP